MNEFRLQSKEEVIATAREGVKVLMKNKKDLHAISTIAKNPRAFIETVKVGQREDYNLDRCEQMVGIGCTFGVLMIIWIMGHEQFLAALEEGEAEFIDVASSELVKEIMKAMQEGENK